MRKLVRFITMLLVVVQLSTVMTVTGNATSNMSEFAGGSGTVEKPYLISTAEHLYNVTKYLNAHFKMINDIDLTVVTEKGGTYDFRGRGWKSIGGYGSSAFSGTFDGDGHTIKGLRIYLSNGWPPDISGSSYVGLFSYVTGTIHDLHMINVNITNEYDHGSSWQYSGAIAAKVSGTGMIENCSVSGTVTGGSDAYCGGLVGYNSGKINSCYNEATVSSSLYAGGIAGYNEGTKAVISNCYNKENIYSSLSGGIVACNRADIENSYNVGVVKSTPTSSGLMGGIAKDNFGTITNSYYLSGTGRSSTVSTVLTDAEMELQSSYEGFDFENVWTMTGDDNYLYPELQCFSLSGSVSISGNVAYDETVMVDLSKLKKVPKLLTYQWYLNGKFVDNGLSYTVKSADIGKKLTVKVSSSEQFCAGFLSSPTYVISKGKQTGIPVASKILYLDDNKIEISTVPTQEYSIDNKNWQTSGEFENLLPNKTYKVYSRILENDLYLLGKSVEIFSITTNRRPLSGKVKITGTTRFGDTLTVDVSELLPLGATFSYEWRSNGVVVGTEKIYKITQDDISKDIVLYVNGTDNYIGTISSASVTATKTTVQVPDAPIIVGKTSTTVSLAEKVGYEYSMDKIMWQDSPVFTGLNAATEYYFYQRVKETDTNFVSVTSDSTKEMTLKNTVAAPQKPVVDRITNNSIVLKAMEEYEYSIDGLNWQRSNIFDGLNPNTEYSFCQRIAENMTDYASMASDYIIVTTLKNTVVAPTAPTIQKATATSVTLVAINGYEYSLNGKTWQTNNIFTGLNTLETYTFYQRIKETDTDYASENSTGTSFKVKFEASKPVAPTLNKKTNNEISVVVQTDHEYSLDKIVWNTTGVFVNLQPNQTYSVYCRILENETYYASEVSDAMNVTTLKNIVLKPLAPILSVKTNTSVTLVNVAGVEYSNDAIIWQSSNVFDGLLPNETYTFYQRFAETSTTYASEKSLGLSVTTYKNTVSSPNAPTLQNITGTSIVLNEQSGCEYSIDGMNWQKSNVFTGLKPKTTYNLYQRYEETSTSYVSDKSESLLLTTPKITVIAPAAPVVRDVSATIIVLKKNEGYEYSQDGITWQDSNVFTGLTANTQYTFYQRVKETDITLASAASSALKVKTAEKSVCSIKPAKPIVAVITSNKIVLVKRDGYEYCINNGAWTTNTTFTGLKENTSYTVKQRIAETAEEFASGASQGVSVTTAAIYAGSTSASRYEQLRSYIYANATSANGKVLKITEYQSNSTYTYGLTNQNEGILFWLENKHKGTSGFDVTIHFTLYPDSKYINVDSTVAYFSGGEVMDMAMDSNIVVNRSTYTSNTKLYSSESGFMLITSSDFSEFTTKTTAILCSYWNLHFFSKLGFDLGELGFTSFVSNKSSVCDVPSGYHVGSLVIRNQREAGCLFDGNTGDYYCSKCGEKARNGTVIPGVGMHSYDNTCDKTCNTCGEERRVMHTYISGCDRTCDICGYNRTSLQDCDYTDSENCIVCGSAAWIPGDVDGNGKIDSNDAICLLRNTLFPQLYKVVVEYDADGNGKYDSEDAIHLLRYTLFPSLYPLK